MATPERRGLFVTLEGGEGAGKSTQADLLAQRLRSQGHATVLSREPAATDLGRFIQRLLADNEVALDPLAELLLFEAARAQHVAEVLRPALERGDIVICDRYTDSTIVYQGHGRGLDLGLIRSLNAAATGGISPDLTVLLDLSPEVGLARKDRETVTDRIGSESLEFHQRVRQGYLALAREEPDRFLVVDAALPPPQVTEAITERLRACLPAGRSSSATPEPP